MDAVKELNVSLVMIGKSLAQADYDKDNPWNADLNRVNELAKENEKIVRLGFVPTEDLVGIYNLSSVFVTPSLYEGFGLPVLEAMACGCPVITTKEGSLAEVAGSAAFYVDAYDVASISSGIQKVLDNEKLQQELREKGLENVKKFSWKKTAQETIKVYERVLGK